MPLFDPHALTGSQKTLYDSMDSKMVPWTKLAGFKAKLGDGRLVGPFNSILASPEIASSFLALQASEQEHTSLSERVRKLLFCRSGLFGGRIMNGMPLRRRPESWSF